MLTYRDLTQQLEGTDRSLPVASDDARIMLCALDYDSPEAVTVNDLVYTRTPEGWQLHKSSYPKLRIAADALAERIEALGFTVTHHAPEPNGMERSDSESGEEPGKMKRQRASLLGTSPKTSM